MSHAGGWPIAIDEGDNAVSLSAATIWESAVKQAAGRLRRERPLIPAAQASALVERPIAWAHAGRAASASRRRRGAPDPGGVRSCCPGQD